MLLPDADRWQKGIVESMGGGKYTKKKTTQHFALVSVSAEEKSGWDVKMAFNCKLHFVFHPLRTKAPPWSIVLNFDFSWCILPIRMANSRKLSPNGCCMINLHESQACSARIGNYIGLREDARGWRECNWVHKSQEWFKFTEK